MRNATATTAQRVLWQRLLAGEAVMASCDDMDVLERLTDTLRSTNLDQPTPGFFTATLAPRTGLVPRHNLDELSRRAGQLALLLKEAVGDRSRVADIATWTNAALACLDAAIMTDPRYDYDRVRLHLGDE